MISHILDKFLAIFFLSLILLFSDAALSQNNLLRSCPDFDLPKDFDASVNSVSRLYSGSSPLFFALLENNIVKLETLLKAGENPTICGPAGVSPLSLAASSSLPSYVDILINYGANPNYPTDSIGSSPLFHALSAMKYDTAYKLLTKNADAKIINDSGLTTLHQLAIAPIHQKKHLKDQQNAMAIELIALGVDVNAQQKQGFTALMLATIANNKELVKLFLQKGASVGIKSARGETALSYSQKRGHSEIEYLLKDFELINKN